jgi:hypothetical protein
MATKEKLSSFVLMKEDELAPELKTLGGVEGVAKELNVDLVAGLASGGDVEKK